MSKSTYVMKCGCRLQREEIIFYRGARRCPNHKKSGIKEIRRTCIDCQVEFTIKPLQTTMIRCDSCRKEYKKLSDRRDYWRKKKKHVKPVEPKIDLSLYTQGLSRYLPEFKKESLA